MTVFGLTNIVEKTETLAHFEGFTLPAGNDQAAANGLTAISN